METLPYLDVKVVVNNTTGNGNGEFITYLDNTGTIQTFRTPSGGKWSNSKLRTSDEFLVIDDSVDAKIVGIVDTKRLNDTVSENNIKPFEPSTALQNLVNDIVERSKEYDKPVNYILERLSNVERELNFELANREITQMQNNLFSIYPPFDYEDGQRRYDELTIEDLNQLYHLS